MIRLKKDGKYFDIDDGETPTIEWVSTVFNDDADFKGSYSYTIKAPFSANNNTLLKNAHQIENRSARYAVDIVIEIFGQQWKQASMPFSITPEGYELNCLIDNGEFANLIKTKMLPEIFVVLKDNVLYDYQYEWLSGDPQETINVLTDRANNPGKGSCVFFSQKNDQMFGSFDGDTPPYDANYTINYYENTPAFLTYCQANANRKKAFYNPSYYLRWVITQVCKYLGFDTQGDFFTDSNTIGLVIDNTGILDLFDVFAFDGCKLAPAKHLPNIKIADFFKYVRSTFKLAIYFDGNERIAYFNYAPKIALDPDAVDISGFTEAGITIQSYVPTGYELVQAVDNDDALFKTFQYTKSYFIGDSGDDDPQQLNTFIGTLFMTDVTDVRPGTTAKWRVPRKRQLANAYTGIAQGTEAYNDGGYSKNDFAFRALNYIGPKFDSAGNVYYYATSDGKNPDATVNPNILSLWLGDTNGLIEKYLKAWFLYFLRTEDVEITAHLPGSLLLKLSPIKKITWTTPTRALIPAMINQISFEQSDVYENKIAAKIRVYPVYNQAATDVKAFTEFQPGDIENEGSIYVKFRLETVSEDSKTLFGQKIVSSLIQTGWLDFFSDEACSKPRNVSSLPVNMLYNYRGKNARNYVIDQHFSVTASGTSYQIQTALGISQTIYYKNSGDYWNKYYALLDGPDYIVVK